MTQTSFIALAEAFERIVGLPESERAAALAALPEPLRDELERLLRADRHTEDPLATVLQDLGDHFHSTRTPGARLGPWQVLRELGAGGMGTVLLAERADGTFEQRAAIKLIRGFPTEDSRRRLRQERRILAQLDHPGIARLIDGGETDDGQPWVAMEYVEGRTLAEYIRLTRPSLVQRLNLFDRIAQAVAHAHQRLVIHRDLKPGNVLVNAEGEPKLLDFGVAKLIELGEDSARRETSTRVWTEGYASPEQREGRAVTTASDVYALGVMLRELLAGDTGPPAAGGFPRLQIDAELRGVIAMACADAPARRYPTVEALRDELDRYREGRPLRAAADTRLYRLRKFLRRHRLSVTAVTLALALLSTAVVWLQHERAQALAAQQRAERAEATRVLQYRFLAEVLQGAAGKREDGSPLLATDLLDRMRGRLEGEAGGDRLARSELEFLLASAYLNAGRWADAKPLFIASANHGEGLKDPADTAYSRREAARMALMLGELDLAQGLLDQAERTLGPPPYSVGAAAAAVRVGLSRIQLMKDRGDPQLDRQVQATVEAARAWLPEGHLLRALALGEQAARTEQRGDFAALVEQRREVLATFLAAPTAYPSDIATQRLNLARALEYSGDLAAAATELDAADRIHREIHAELGHRDRVELRMRRASLALARCEPDQAQAEFEAAGTMAETLELPPRAIDALLAARIAQAQQRPAEAQAHFERALSLDAGGRLRARIEAAQRENPSACSAGAQPPT